MGEILLRKWFLFFALICSFVFVLFSIGVFAAVHPLYSGFSSANSGFMVDVRKNGWMGWKPF